MKYRKKLHRDVQIGDFRSRLDSLVGDEKTHTDGDKEYALDGVM